MRFSFGYLGAGTHIRMDKYLEKIDCVVAAKITRGTCSYRPRSLKSRLVYGLEVKIQSHLIIFSTTIEYVCRRL